MDVAMTGLVLWMAWRWTVWPLLGIALLLFVNSLASAFPKVFLVILLIAIVIFAVRKRQL